MPNVHPPPRLPGTLRLAMLLASAAGFLDAYVYLHVTPVFVANHSGNLIRLGMDLGTQRWAEAGIAACAIAAFVIGVGAATISHDRHRQMDRRPRIDLLLLGEAALLCVVFALIVIGDHSFSVNPRFDDYPIIFLAALAMGLQTSSIGRVGTVIMSTTYASGSMAKIGEHSVLGARSDTTHEKRGHRRAVTILAAVTVSYVAGAVLAATLRSWTWTLLIPILGVAFAAFVAYDRTDP